MREYIHTVCWFKVRANPESWEGYDPVTSETSLKEWKETEDSKPGQVGKVKGHWNVRLSIFQKLVFIKAFQEEKVCVFFAPLYCRFLSGFVTDCISKSVNAIASVRPSIRLFPLLTFEPSDL